jgi:mRNA-degrading endonuclease toxin of MazEF toxin-antitoxin module
MSEDAPRRYAPGSIVLVEFERVKAGSRTRKLRPCVTLTDPIQIRRSRHAALLYGIVPLTTRSRAAAGEFAPRFVAREGGLPADAMALCVYFRTVEAERIVSLVGELNAKEIVKLEGGLMMLLSAGRGWKMPFNRAKGEVRDLLRSRKGEELATAVADLFDISQNELDEP